MKAGVLFRSDRVKHRYYFIILSSKFSGPKNGNVGNYLHLKSVFGIGFNGRGRTCRGILLVRCVLAQKHKTHEPSPTLRKRIIPDKLCAPDPSWTDLPL